MNLSRQGLMELIGHEAIVQTRYRDTAGVWTIGVGHTRAAGPPDPRTFEGTMSLTEVIALFRRDVTAYSAAVRAAIRVPVSQTEFDALVSFHYNTGAIGRAALVRSLNAGNRARAAQEFLNWSRPRAILERRLKERKLFAEGIYSNGGRASVVEANSAGRVIWTTERRIELERLV